MNIKFLSLGILALGLGLFSACKQDDPRDGHSQVEANESAEPQLLSVQSSGKGSNYLTLSLEMTSGQELRATSYDENSDGTYTTTTVTGEETAHCVLRKKGDASATTYVDIKWKGRGNRALRFDKIQIQLPENVEFRPQDEWYITGIIGGTSFDKTNGQVRMGNADGSAVALTNAVVPYSFPWTRLTTNEGYATSVNVSFKPLGTVLRLQFYSNMIGDYRAKSVRMESNAIRSAGVFDMMSTTDDNLGLGNQYPNWTPRTTDTSLQSYTYTLGEGTDSPSLTLPSGASWNASRTLVLWGMPVSTTDEESRATRRTAVYLNVLATNTGTETTNMGSATENVTEVRTYQQFNHRAMESGKTYRLSNVLTSDPIISEIYYQYTSAGDTEYAGQHNYSIVEIYNPTLKPIDLRQYALTRLYYETNQHKYRYYVAQSNSHTTSVIEGNLLPLSAIAGSPDVTFGDHRGYYEGGDATWRRRINPSNANPSTTLAPGKTILIGAGGYIQTQRNPDANLRLFDNAVTSGTITADDLNYGSQSSSKYTQLQTKVRGIEREYYPRVGGQIDSAILRGYCQGFIALDNSGHKDQNPHIKDIAPRQKYGGTLQLGSGQGLGLVKYVGLESGQEQSSKYALVDISVPLDNQTEATAYLQNLKSQLLSSSSETVDNIERDELTTSYSASRRGISQFATPQFDPKAWQYTRSENEGVKSLGTRLYVAGRSPFALNYAGYTTANNPKGLSFWSNSTSSYTAPSSAQWSTLPTQGGGNTVIDPSLIKTGRKVNIVSGKASSQQGGETIEKSFDGDYNTIYHSPWSNRASNYFPISLTYNLGQAETLTHMIYYPRRDGYNGYFKVVDIYTIVKGKETRLKTVDFGGVSTPTKVSLDTPTSVNGIKLVVRSGHGDGQGFASAAEIEFYASEADQFDYKTIFTDPSCSQLKAGVTESNIKGITNKVFQDLALKLYQNKYNSEFRVAEYKAYPHSTILQTTNKTQYPYSRQDNPTGIAVSAGEDLIVCVGDTHGYNQLSIMVQNLDKPNGDGFGNTNTYPLSTGINKIKIENKGLVYVMYNVSDLTGKKPIKVHFLNGVVNGYYDSQNPKLRGRWRELLAKASNPYFDVVGEFAHLIFPTIRFRTNTPDGLALINAYDKVVKSEMELLGLYKYGGVFQNRMLLTVMYHQFMYATNYHTAYNDLTLDNLTNVGKLTSSHVWGVAHEIGHMNQTQGLLWKGMTEVTTNIMSLHIQTSIYNQPARIQDEALDEMKRGSRYSKAFSLVQAKEVPFSQAGDVFCNLVPFWQLQLYFGKLKNRVPSMTDKGGFYPEIYNYLRTHNSLSAPGEEQTEFPYIASYVAKADLTDFFEKWGFFKVVDTEVDDYGKARLTVTQTRVNEVKRRIKALGYAKPDVNLEFISDETMEWYRNPSSSYNVGQVNIRNNGTRFEITGSQNIVAYEFYDANGRRTFIHSIRPQHTNNYEFPLEYRWTTGCSVKAIPVKGTAVSVTPSVQ